MTRTSATSAVPSAPSGSTTPPPAPPLSAKLKTLLAIVGPGLIVMVGDNDAGAFSTYGQAGQDYGTRLLWTLLLLIPVLYVNQEMVLRLGAVTGVGHARLILARFGKFWGAFSVIDLFILNALTIMTEFIGITLAAGYLGVPKVIAVAGAALIIVASAFTGSFRRFERIAMTFCVGSLLLIPLYFMSHPSLASMGRGFAIPVLPGGGGQMATVMLLVIGIVGTTVAPWQLFFQQSYVIDKRITPRFMKYEKADLWIGIAIVVVGAAALMGVTAAAFAGTRGAGNFTDSAGLAHGIAAYAGHFAGRGVRDRAARRGGHRRVRGLALQRLRDRRRARAEPLPAPGVRAGEGVLRGLRGAGRRRRRDRADPRLAARADHRGRPGPGGRAAAERDGLPAAALQRQGRARPVGEPARHQRVHLGGDRGPDHAVGGAHRVGGLPRHHRRADRRDLRCLRGGVGPGRPGDAGPPSADPRRGRRGDDRGRQSAWRTATTGGCRR